MRAKATGEPWSGPQGACPVDSPSHHRNSIPFQGLWAAHDAKEAVTEVTRGRAACFAQSSRASWFKWQIPPGRSILARSSLFPGFRHRLHTAWNSISLEPDRPELRPCLCPLTNDALGQISPPQPRFPRVCFLVVRARWQSLINTLVLTDIHRVLLRCQA